MIKTTPRFKLLRKAAAIIDGIPEDHFNLSQVMRPPHGWEEAITITSPAGAQHCGAIGCAIGWLGLHPKFQARGLLTVFRRPEDNMLGTLQMYVDDEPESYDTAAALIFRLVHDDGEPDEDAANKLFSAPFESPYDNTLSATGSQSHKEMFRHRVRCFLEEHGQEVNPDY